VALLHAALVQADGGVEGLRQSIAEGRNPRDVKVLLAQELVARFHGAAAAVAALEDFEARFQRNAIPDDLPEVSLIAGEAGLAIAGVLKQAGLTASTSESLRMIDQGGFG
jgi:tyrosyl-tRNA synthetase